MVQQPSLAEWLRTDRAAVRKLLDDLAFEAHRDQPDLVGTADIPQTRLVSGLMALANTPDVKLARVIEYVCDRAGLLAVRGAGGYTFPQRTFQEYLAACHLTGASFPDEVAELTLADGECWREVALLAGAKAARAARSLPRGVWPRRCAAVTSVTGHATANTWPRCWPPTAPLNVFLGRRRLAPVSRPDHSNTSGCLDLRSRASTPDLLGHAQIWAPPPW